MMMADEEEEEEDLFEDECLQEFSNNEVFFIKVFLMCHLDKLIC